MSLYSPDGIHFVGRGAILCPHIRHQAAQVRLRHELARAVASALDVDVVVQQVGYRASMSRAS